MKKYKMNGLFKVAVALLIACAVCGVAVLILSLATEKSELVTAFGAAGVVCAIAGIVFAVKSDYAKEPDPVELYKKGLEVLDKEREEQERAEEV